MHVNHCDPDEAVKIHEEIKSLQSVAVHWGTFKLGREVFVFEPSIDFKLL
jgi:N-acyl-phosphatidylethanolamine-hydrolysing phospholipase D